VQRADVINGEHYSNTGTGKDAVLNEAIIRVMKTI